jgi:hypothetical protein
LIVGESLFGVLLAALIVGSGRETPLAVVGDSFSSVAVVLGGLAFVIVIVAMYRWIQRLSKKVAGLQSPNA